MNDDGKTFATQTVHAGEQADPATNAREVPIYQTTSYAFTSADQAASLYALDAEDDIYSRISNPTVRALEDRLTHLHGAAGAVATASGMAALDAAAFVLADSGDNIVTASGIYGGTSTYFRHAAERRGVAPRFVETLDYEAYDAAVDHNTAFVHLETIGNPSLVTPDIARVADIAHDAGAPLFIDNTFASPALCRPIEHGADAVWSSTTKWIHGHGSTVGGVLIDGGTFDWDADRFAEIGGKNRAYHDTNFSKDFAEAPLAAAARYRSIRTLGGCQSPIDAWLTLQGLETLPLRMGRHCENAAIVAKYLDDHAAVSWVKYPGLADHETHTEAKQYLRNGFGGMVSFGLVDGYDAARKLCEETELFSFLANVGDTKSLIIHPASTTHGQLTAEEQRAAGVPRVLIRLSVGIEEPADLLADLDDGISASSA